VGLRRERFTVPKGGGPEIFFQKRKLLGLKKFELENFFDRKNLDEKTFRFKKILARQLGRLKKFEREKFGAKKI